MPELPTDGRSGTAFLMPSYTASDRYGRENLVTVHGSAPGVDSAFHQASVLARVESEPHPADWTWLGKTAGPVRNAAMVTMSAGLRLAVYRSMSGSKGTKGCLRQALAAGIPTYLIDSDDGEPERLSGQLQIGCKTRCGTC